MLGKKKISSSFKKSLRRLKELLFYPSRLCCGLAGKHDTVISYRDAILDLCNEAVDRFGLEGTYNVIEFNPYFVFSFPL